MRKSAVKFLVIATVLLLSRVVFAHDAPHLTGYGCHVCHTVHNALGPGGTYSNLCLSCHRPSNWNPNSTSTLPGKYIRSFNYGDMANPFNNDAGQNANPNRMQTSHKWMGPDNVPAAGALPPTNPDMSPAGRLYMQDRLSCFRCHDMAHSPKPNTKLFLRDRIDADQLCFDCHRSRNLANHLYGTHPVNFSYTSSKVRTKPDEYYPSPVNANPSNPSSNLNLKNGKVVCTTCHGMHFTDSNSATMDNYSSVVLDRLSSSRGNLLRTDQRRGSPAERNICMNCHRAADILNAENQLPENPKAQVKNHNGKKKNQNVQCVDCHGGHVEYPGAGAPPEESTPNIYLINRFMNLSSPIGAYSPIRNKKVLFQNITSKNYNREYGVCVACHTPPTWVSQHSSTDAKVCATCHKHSAGFSADCTTCHGYPPVDNSEGGPNGYAASPYKYSDYPDVYKDESKTPHKTHAGGGAGYTYKCDECHKGNSHATGTFQNIFIDTNGITASPLAHYSTTRPGTCKSVYCHSNGSGTYKSPTWENGRDTILNQPGECSSCHEAKPVTSAHQRHVAGGSIGKSFVCYNCHGETVNSSSEVVDKTKHVNGTKDIAFRGTLGINAIVGCSTCHNDGNGGLPVVFSPRRNLETADFRDPNNGKCGTCHSYPMINYGHPAHMSATYGPQFEPAGNPNNATAACSRCHVYTGELGDTHVDGTKQVDTVKCVTCHPSGGPTWTAGVRLQCESCHTGQPRSVFNNITAPDKSQAALTGHGKPDGANRICTDCHNNNAQHLSSEPTSHTFRLLTTLSSGTVVNKGCKYCHDDISRINNKAQFLNMSTHFKDLTRNGGGQTLECWQCHDPHGTSNKSMIRTKIAYKNSTTWTISFLNNSTGMVNKETNRGLCQVCHNKTKYWQAGMQENGHPDRNCFGCHRHNARGGAFKPAGGCNFCHGYPPVPKSAIIGPAETNDRYDPRYKQRFGTMGNYSSARFEDYSGGGGAHLWHVRQDAKPSEGWDNCSVCHSGGNSVSTTHQVKLPIKQNIANVTLNINPRYRFNDAILPRYSGARLVNPPEVNKTGQCVNVMCHFGPSPLWDPNR